MHSLPRWGRGAEGCHKAEENQIPATFRSLVPSGPGAAVTPSWDVPGTRPEQGSSHHSSFLLLPPGWTEL